MDLSGLNGGLENSVFSSLSFGDGPVSVGIKCHRPPRQDESVQCTVASGCARRRQPAQLLLEQSLFISKQLLATGFAIHKRRQHFQPSNHPGTQSGIASDWVHLLLIEQRWGERLVCVL